MTPGRLLLSQNADRLERKVAEIVAGRIAERTGLRLEVLEGAGADAGGLLLGTAASQGVRQALEAAGGGLADGREAYAFAPGERRQVLAANRPEALVFAAGDLLRRSRFRADGWQLPADRFAGAPAKPIRPIYFATHFGNWYCQAPLDEIGRYLEDLALWGYNQLVTWFDLHHYASFEDGAEVWNRLTEIDALAREVGMGVARVGIANESFAGQAPPELRARGRLEGTGYDTDLCPSRPEAREIILANRREYLHRIRDTTSLDWLCFWPYDQGGCNCELCTPWPQTYLDLCRELAAMTREVLPDTEPVVSAWWIGTHVEDEDQPFFEALGRGEDWFRTIVAGTVEMRRWLATGRTVPEPYGVLLFPEISMFDALPWGGRGANPAPTKFAEEMRELGPHLVGAMPYSEGRYEDVNKAVWAQLLWDPQRDVRAIIGDYCEYHFGLDGKRGSELLLQLERGIRDLSLAESNLELTLELEAGLPEWGRQDWRWQVLRSRSEIDALKVRLEAGGLAGGDREEVLQRLRQVYERLQHDLYRHDERLSLRNWIYLPFETWLTLPFNELVLPTGV